MKINRLKNSAIGPTIVCGLAFLVAVPKVNAQVANKTVLTAAPGTQEAGQSVHELNRTFEALVNRIPPAVVEVMVTGYGTVNEADTSETSPVGRARSVGAGVVVDPDGYILTNHHVVKGADRVRVRITPTAAEDSQAYAQVKEKALIYPAHVLGFDREIDLAVLRKDLATALESYRVQANQLSARRVTAGRALAKDITTRMQTLGMAGGRFQVDVTQDGNSDPAQHGVDQIDFKVTANPGQPLRALSKVASGGELSRLSLAVQVSCAARETRCMVFDEVDSGIGGAIAEIVGKELRALGARSQVLCVTHLPQVASQGHHHLRVTKLTDGKTTRTALTDLSTGDRVEEIARMLGGVEVTAKAREHAKEMLKVAAETATSEATQKQKRPASGKAR